MARRQFKRRRGIKKAFGKKKTKLMSVNNRLNYLGIKPFLKKITTDLTISAIIANGQFAGTYSFGSTTSAVTAVGILSSMNSLVTFTQLRDQFGMFQIKAVELGFVPTLNPNAPLGPGLAGGPYYFSNLPELSLAVVPPFQAGSAVGNYNITRSGKFKIQETTKKIAKKTYVFPDICTGFDANNQSFVWGNKVWYSSSEFNSLVSTSNQPMICLGFNEAPALNVTNSSGSSNVFGIAHVSISWWIVMASDTVPTTM